MGDGDAAVGSDAGGRFRDGARTLAAGGPSQLACKQEGLGNSDIKKPPKVSRGKVGK